LIDCLIGYIVFLTHRAFVFQEFLDDFDEVLLLVRIQAAGKERKKKT